MYLIEPLGNIVDRVAKGDEHGADDGPGTAGATKAMDQHAVALRDEAPHRLGSLADAAKFVRGV